MIPWKVVHILEERMDTDMILFHVIEFSVTMKKCIEEKNRMNMELGVYRKIVY